MTTNNEAPADFLARAIHAIPDDPRNTAWGPDVVQVEALHLSVTQTWESGSSHNLHVLENGDIGVILKRGNKRSGSDITPGDTGTVVVSLAVDDDHDEVQYSHRNNIGAEEALGQAIEALVAARWAIKQSSAVAR